MNTNTKGDMKESERTKTKTKPTPGDETTMHHPPRIIYRASCIVSCIVLDTRRAENKAEDGRRKMGWDGMERAIVRRPQHAIDGTKSNEDEINGKRDKEGTSAKWIGVTMKMKRRMRMRRNGNGNGEWKRGTKTRVTMKGREGGEYEGGGERERESGEGEGREGRRTHTSTCRELRVADGNGTATSGRAQL